MINLVLALLTCMNVFWSKYVPSLDLLIHRFSRYFLHISLLYFWRFISFQQMWKWVCNSKQHQIFNRCKLKLHILEALRIRSLIQTYFELIHFGKKLVELMEVHSRYAFESLGFLLWIRKFLWITCRVIFETFFNGLKVVGLVHLFIHWNIKMGNFHISNYIFSSKVRFFVNIITQEHYLQCNVKICYKWKFLIFFNNFFPCDSIDLIKSI
jgi:hypothetical protein